MLACGLAVGFAGTLIILAGPWKGSEGLGLGSGYLLSTIGGAMVGAVAAYLGMRHRRKDD